MTAPSRRANRAAAQVRRDLELLPAILASPSDWVAVERPPSPTLLDRWAAARVAVPRFLETRWSAETPHLEHRPDLARVEFHPWGWNSRSHAWARTLDLPPPAGLPPWTPERQATHSKAWSSTLAREFVEQQDSPLLCAAGDLPRVCRDLEELERTRRAFVAAGRSLLVVKGVYGVSGRDMTRSLDGSFTDNQRSWARKKLESDGVVLIEPWLDAIADVSVRAELGVDCEIVTQGVGRSLTDGRGQYRGSILTDLETSLRSDPTCSTILTQWDADETKEQIADVLRFVAPRLAERGHQGPIGLDALLYRREAMPRVGFHPLLELNPRFTMGHVAAALTSHVHGDAVGVWLLIRRAEIDQGPWADQMEFLGHLDQRLPLRLADDGRMKSGVLPTSDPMHDGQLFGVMMVGDSLVSLRALLGAAAIPLDSTPVGHAGRLA
jgi:hypothetical protein